MEVIDEKPITLAEVKEILTKLDENLMKNISVDAIRIINKAKNYSIKFAKVSYDEANEIKERLRNLNLNLSEEYIVKIIDILPKNPDELRSIFSKDEKFKYNEDEIKRILSCIPEYDTK